MKIIILLSILLISSCATRVIVLPKYKTVDQVVYPGKVKRISVKIPVVGEDHKLICGGDTLSTLEDGGQLKAFFSVNYKYLDQKKSKSIPCFLNSLISGERINFHVFNMRVKSWNYPKSYIKVKKKHIDLSKKDLNRFLSEKKIINAVYEKSRRTKKLFRKPFMRPLKSKVTGVYGSRRIFNNKKDAWHSGTDMRARTPTPIPSSNEGVVAFSGHLFFNGNAVFVDHGMGVITMYCHLSKRNVKKGDKISKGQIIGISGNTGRSSAPHLHWGVRVQNNWVDGLQFIKAQKAKSLETNYQSASNNK